MSHFLDIPVVGIGAAAQDLADVYVSATHHPTRIDSTERWDRPAPDIDLSVDVRIDHVRTASLNEYRNLCGSDAADLLEDFGAEVAADAPSVPYALTSSEWDWYCEEVFDNSDEEWNEYVARVPSTLDTPATLRLALV